jgi:MinD superfamily P-loop ATPase
MSEGLNHYGYRTATYAGAGCTGCGICFMACPEPGAITVLRVASHVAAIVRGVETNSLGASECASN